MRLRDAVPGDAAAIAAIHVRSWQAAYRGLLPDPVLDGLEVSARERQWRGILTPGPDGSGAGPVTVVAEVGGAPAGFVHVGASRDTDADAETDAETGLGEVWSLYVDPRYWRGGVGRALMAAGLDRLRDAGAVRATLWVLAGNVRAIAFYAATGWRPDGTTRTDELRGVVVDEIRLARSLCRPDRPA